MSNARRAAGYTTHCYVRASLNKQQDSPETQKHTINAYLEAQKLEFPLWYVDVATTSKIMLPARESGREMMRRLKRGDHIVIAKLDRAFRSLRDCVTVLDEIKRLGVSLHVCDLFGGAIDLSAPIGMFLIQMLAVFAELERKFIGERTRDGMRAARRRGFGGGHPSYGFKHEPRWRIMPDGTKKRGLFQVRDDHDREIMGLIVGFRVEGWSWDQIREKLNYELKMKTSKGKELHPGTIRQMAKAELMLRLQEMNTPGGECDAPSH